MGKWVDNRESEIQDLIWDGVSAILDETMPLLSEEQGAFDGSTSYDGSTLYSKTLRGKLHQKFFDQIWPNVSKQLDGVEEDINTCVEVEVDKATQKCNEEFVEMENQYENTISELKDEIEAWKSDRIGKYKMNKGYGL